MLTLVQARSAGLSDSAVGRKLQSGQWRRCGPGVYFADDRPFTLAARIRAAVWARGPRAAASGLAAAWWLGLMTTAPACIEVTVPRNSHGRAAPGCRLRRRDLADLDVVEHRGLRVTALALTVLEAAVRRGGGPAGTTAPRSAQAGRRRRRIHGPRCHPGMGLQRFGQRCRPRGVHRSRI